MKDARNGFLQTGLRFSSPFKIFMQDIWASKSLVPDVHALLLLFIKIKKVKIMTGVLRQATKKFKMRFYKNYV
jgi:hypothetical protein